MTNQYHHKNVLPILSSIATATPVNLNPSLFWLFNNVAFPVSKSWPRIRFAFGGILKYSYSFKISQMEFACLTCSRRRRQRMRKQRAVKRGSRARLFLRQCRLWCWGEWECCWVVGSWGSRWSFLGWDRLEGRRWSGRKRCACYYFFLFYGYGVWGDHLSIVPVCSTPFAKLRLKVYLKDSSLIHECLVSLNSDVEITSLDRLQYHPILQVWTMFGEVGNNVVVEYGTKLIVVLHCSLKLWSLRLLQLYLARSMLHWYFVWLGWKLVLEGRWDIGQYSRIDWRIVARAMARQELRHAVGWWVWRW